MDVALLSSVARPDLTVLFGPASILGSGQSRNFAHDTGKFLAFIDELETASRQILAIDLNKLEFVVRGDSIALDLSEDDLGTTFDMARASLAFLTGHSGRTVRRLASIHLPARAPMLLLVLEQVTDRFRHILALLAAALGEDDEFALQESAVPRAPSPCPPGPSVRLDF